MPRFAIGVTLTPEERALMKLPPQGDMSQPPSRVSSHETAVALPDGTSCPVSYRRFGACSHRFTFGEPLREGVWLSDRMDSYVPTIEQKAQELAPKAFAQAMAEEQRMMRHKAVPKGSVLPPGEPQVQAKAANVLAGCYAVCLRLSSGRLSAIGTAHATHGQPAAELADGSFAHVQLYGEQRLVTGICCRYLRRWVEPRFLPCPRGAAARVPQADPAS